MRSVLLLAVTVVMFSSDEAVAQTQPQQAQVQAQRSGPFGRLVELERRKNAWLRRTFLGR